MSSLVRMTKLEPFNVVQSDVTEYDPPIKYLAVFAVDGTIAVTTAQGNDVTFTIPSVANGAGCPFILPGLFSQVLDTGTTIADAALVAYR